MTDRRYRISRCIALFALSLLPTTAVAADKPKGPVELSKELIAEVRKTVDAGSPELAGFLAQVGRKLLEAHEYAAAEPYLRECVEIRDKKQPDEWTTFNSRSMLGAALLGQKKYADAEPLLLMGYGGMKRREHAIPASAADRIPAALGKLVELYAATDKPAEAKKFRAERAKYDELAPAPRPAKR